VLQQVLSKPKITSFAKRRTQLESSSDLSVDTILEGGLAKPIKNDMENNEEENGSDKGLQYPNEDKEVSTVKERSTLDMVEKEDIPMEEKDGVCEKRSIGSCGKQRR
jgi:hypothetical protein